MDVDLLQLPIPDWDLQCPHCGYPLRGLPAHRCPECGGDFDIRELIHPWTRLRAPRYTGHESPLLDFGLHCASCNARLAGAIGLKCGVCGTPFDAEYWRPRNPWFILDRELCGELPIPGVQSLLAAERVPHQAMFEKTLGEIYGGTSMTVTRLRVASEFYYEVLWLLCEARRELLAARLRGSRGSWRCAHCGEECPGHFDICWNCLAERGA